MRGRYFLVLALALPLLGCAGEDDFIDNAIAQARAACEAQGKQFILKSRPQVSSGELMDRDVDIEGACVGPGEP